MRSRTLLLAATLTTGLLTTLPTTPASAAPRAGRATSTGTGTATSRSPPRRQGRRQGVGRAGRRRLRHGERPEPGQADGHQPEHRGHPGFGRGRRRFRLPGRDGRPEPRRLRGPGDRHPEEDSGSLESAGTVVIVWGSASGLSGGTTVKNPEPQYGSSFGLSIAAADFTGDGKPDLAVSTQSSTGSRYKIRLIRGPFTKSGSTGRVSSYSPGVDKPRLTAGKVDKNAKADLVVTGRKTNSEHLAAAAFYKGTSNGLTKGAALRAGTTAAIGDLDGDGYGDIVLGNPDEPHNEPSGSKGGEISVVYGTSTGPSGSRRTTLTQSSAGVPDSPEYGDDFGEAVAVGDLDKDGRADLAIGAPGEAFGDDAHYVSSAGAITLLRGSASGLTTTGAVFLTQDSPGVPGAVESVDSFGSQLLASDVNGDGHADLTAIAAQENDPAGAAWHLPGATGSLYSTTTATTFGPTHLGLSTAQAGAFGSDLAG
uniref:Integrin-like protein n=1 Tax=Streptomyces avermitilis TaxID=33903 RepID=A0A499VDH2_STRAX|nr:hypothetical protein SAVMC3_51220 [Streptomyces avermitilis]